MHVHWANYLQNPDPTIQPTQNYTQFKNILQYHYYFHIYR